MDNKLRIVLDTNVFLVSLLPKHKYWWVFEELLKEKYTLLVTNEILTEYLEKCVEKYGRSLTDERLDFLLDFPNVELITPYYQWRLITDDPDDDKFVDCAVAGQADFLVSHDKHFNILRDVDFPEIQVIRLDEFHNRLSLDQI
jgi:putative PIN family toxin of toxin-antitoxin system